MAFDRSKFKTHMKTLGITQKDLAERFHVDIRTVSRWLDPKNSIKSDTVKNLCLAISASPTDFDPNWEGTIETENVARVSARVSSASKNSYWLLKKLYGVSETEIVELAPTLFAMFAAAVFEGTNKGENDDRKNAAEILAKEYGLISEESVFGRHPEEMEIEEATVKFIKEGKIFGGDVTSEDGTYYFGNVNPFAEEMQKFAKNSKRVKLGYYSGGSCPSSLGTAICIPWINAISDNNPEICEAISRGEIELFGKKFESLMNKPDDRIKWMSDRVSEIKRNSARREAQRMKALPEKYREAIEAIAARRKEYIKNRWGEHSA